MLEDWAASKGANPETCQHRVIQAAYIGDNQHLIICASCDSTLDESWLGPRFEFYEYNIDNNVWVYYGPRSQRRKDIDASLREHLIGYKIGDDLYHPQNVRIVYGDSRPDRFEGHELVSNELLESWLRDRIRSNNLEEFKREIYDQERLDVLPHTERIRKDEEPVESINEFIKRNLKAQLEERLWSEHNFDFEIGPIAIEQLEDRDPNYFRYRATQTYRIVRPGESEGRKDEENPENWEEEANHWIEWIERYLIPPGKLAEWQKCSLDNWLQYLRDGRVERPQTPGNSRHV